MRCYICNNPVVGVEGMTVPGIGPAHRTCYEAKQALSRRFKGLDISGLSDDELTNLTDMVLAEANQRRGDDEDDDVELF